jgi:beta-phosphoglucomutase-like phosphatase (HAD superfamily)
VDGNLEVIGLQHVFDVSVSRDDVVQTKPHPAPYATAVRRLGRPARCSIAVEDSIVGLQSARAAGLYILAFPHGMSPAGLADMADSWIDDLAEIARFCGCTTLPARRT